MRAGEVRYDPITVVDLARTLLDLAGAALPHVADGRSLVSTLRGADSGWRNVMLTEAAGTSPRAPGDVRQDPRFQPKRDGIRDPRDTIGLRTERWKYVRYSDDDLELYDLRHDPFEWRNLARNATWMRRHAHLLTELDKLWVQTRNCAGDACHAPLPADLAVGARQEARATRTWYAEIQRAYGTSGLSNG
jgi:arylsulfatase A-like enzyme